MIKKKSISVSISLLYRVRQIAFFLENALKKLLNIFSNFSLYLKVQYFMVASAGHVIAYTIGNVFKHVIDCVQVYFTNGFTNIVL